jgi:hypothetical protein
VFFDTLDEPVARRRLELTRINFARKFEKWPGVLLKVVDVEHGLRVREIRKIDC